MRQGLLGFLAVVVLLMSGAAMAAEVEVSGDMSIIGVAGQDGLIFPDLSKQTRAVNATDWQMRVVGFCQPGSAIREILGGGAVNCEAVAGSTGTVTSVGTGAGLTGGPVITAGTLSIATGGVTNAMLANPSLTVSAGTGLSGGGAVSLGGSTTLNLSNTTVAPGAYTRANITVDQQGRITSAASNATVNLGTEVTGALPVANGGTGAITPTGALTSLGAAASGVNTDITSLSGLNTQAAITINPYGTVAGATGEIRLRGLAVNGTSHVGFKAPDGIAADSIIWTLPAADGAANQILMTDGSGNLGWATSSGDVTGVTAGTGLSGGGTSGDVTLNADTTYLQRRVSGSCTEGNAVRVVNADGTVTCQAAGSGTVTSVGSGTGLTGGPVTTTGTISLANTAVAPGAYTRANIAVDAQGRLTSAGNGGAVNLAAEVAGILPVANGGTGTATPNFVDLANPQTVGGAKTFSSDLTLSGNLNLPAAGIIKAGPNRLITFGTFGESNFFAGSNAGNQTMTGPGNTAVGSDAFSSNITGTRNTVIGYNALSSNTTGSYNTVGGMFALNSNTEGSYNTASGHMALYSNTSGSNNIAIGHQALYVNTLGGENTAIGNNALFINDTGYGNTASGYHALYSNNTGSYNTATGTGALYSNNTGYYNTATGTGALYSNTTGFGNTASGNNALSSNDAGNDNTASGYSALYSNTTGSNNAASGYYALYSNTIGSYNTASGNNALYSNTTGSKNTAVGASALFTQSYDSGGTVWDSNNTAVGFEALYSNQPIDDLTGNYNTALGSVALRANTTGYHNTALGRRVLYSNINGSFNTASGLGALNSNTGGDSNTASGWRALFSNINGSYNTAFGDEADVASGDLTNATAIGSGAIVDTSNKVRIGNGYVTLVETAGNLRVGAGSTAGCVQDGDGTVIAGICASDEKLKTDIRSFDLLLDRLVQLQPVYFRWKQEEYPELQLGSAESFGLIAQEVEKVLPELVTEDSRNGYKAVKYNMLPLMLLKAIKEQQEIIEIQQTQIDAMRAELKEIKALLSSRK